ncbi:MAG: response regulator transcription factor [Solirubrobacteraceae bacterium]|nr:response regulator transcription factor [Solirubrobacteraceae bacterium]
MTAVEKPEPTPAARRPIRVVLADDHAVVRSGLRMVLEMIDDLEVVAEAGDADSALRVVLGHKPDVLVLDLNMPGSLTPLEALPQVTERNPGTQVVVLTMQDDPEFARQAMRAGARAYVLKDAAGTDLVDAIRSAAAGERYVTPSIGARLAAMPAEREGRPGDLSEREYEVLRLIALGHTNPEIAETLYLSIRTVETHRAHVQQKLGLTTRAELVGYALAHRMLEDAVA